MTTPNNLPAELTSFVGRGPQLAELRRLLNRNRLLTLTGPGGAGKSRLALRLARDLLERYPDGVWLVDLAELADERLLEHTVAAACGFKEESKPPLIDALVRGLGNRRALIVLDGCEHMVESCAALCDALLRSCARLAIVATSREPLGVAGELIWRTPSLTIPRPEDNYRPELLLESEAVRLFVDRARLSRPDIELRPSVATPLAQICTRLEGIPLAIELAAGLAGVMTLEEILERLSHRFRLLTGGSRSSLPRHQTLRQALDWSYGLLSSSEQAIFSRLGVFAVGFDLSAAEAVVEGEPIEAEHVLPLLTQLVHKSLVVAEPGRPHVTRYRLLDTIREYALEKLQSQGEGQWRRRHAAYYTTWCTSATAQLKSSEPVAWLDRLNEEQANLRLALEWNLAERPDDALRLALDMTSNLRASYSLTEGHEWISRALEASSARGADRAMALHTRARLSRRMGNFADVRRDAEACAAIAREHGLDGRLSGALMLLGIVASHDKDSTMAERWFTEAKNIAERIGDRRGFAAGLNNLAMLELAAGNLTDALAHSRESTQIAGMLGDKVFASQVLDTFARISLQLRDLDVARQTYKEALTIAEEFQDAMTVADCLEGMALAAMTSGQLSRGLTLIAAGDALRAATGGEPTAELYADVQAAGGRAEARLGAAAADAARQKGAAMTMHEAVLYAVGEPGGERSNGPTRLTAREVQVARLIQDGKTNSEVAHALRISERTVDAHVEHIRNKVGLRTRAQIAVWAHERLGNS